MTNKERAEYAFELVEMLIKNKAYIKGHGDKFRICDEKHSPLKNISKQEMDILLSNNIVEGNGLFWVLSVTENPLKLVADIKLR